MNEIRPGRGKRAALLIEAIDEISILSQQIGEVEAKFMPLVAELENKLVASIARVDNHALEKQAEFSRVADREKKVFEAKLNTAVTKTVNRMVNEVERADGLSVRSQVLIALTIAITASAISVYGSYWLFGREQAEQAAIGRAVMAVWNELDEKSKSKIEQAY
ncbi:MAG: hypothetical protein Q8K07_17895 [Methylicorpusculum sp.]|uniref:hypothetical protein n=1 Tax=Methylicorpusculum sp. TaxID=2713644 RepID=UPI00273118CE|nr:hypothetical protein [Methylicorpusculum sp.]MDP2177091.1 hypothetical protein [Methylicorpusculum sp.]MDP2203894.1 hypothetical protein [Methylicorpusculum sp.]MDP3529328.1 hypothetical protein [Methylicorpusculum sp.]MDZ4150492.1 hypothetical protein [Methylicorpusculum sp.]